MTVPLHQLEIITSLLHRFFHISPRACLTDLVDLESLKVLHKGFEQKVVSISTTAQKLIQMEWLMGPAEFKTTKC